MAGLVASGGGAVATVDPLSSAPSVPRELGTGYDEDAEASSYISRLFRQNLVAETPVPDFGGALGVATSFHVFKGSIRA